MSVKVPDKIIIVNDLDQLPPPFCYRYRIEIQLKNLVEVGFEVEYYDREELNEDEIIAEGFSENDDFEWIGRLSEQWRGPILGKIEKLHEGASRKNLKITLINAGLKKDFYAPDIIAFEYFVQELIQAIYEASGRQEKFSFQLFHQSNNQGELLSFEVSFYDRSAQVNQQAIDWTETEHMMKDLFILEFDSFNASQKKPVKEGYYISPGDGLWYKEGMGVKNTSKKSLIPLFEDLFKKYK